MSLLIVAILIVSEISLLLSHIGCFSLLGVVLGLIIVLIIFRPRQSLSLFILIPVLVIAFFFFFQPYQYMDGGWDPGNYINTGVHIARTGSVIYHDSMLKETAGFIRTDGTGIKYPGLYIKDADKGLVVPQFFHLFPVWIAIFYKLFGLKAVFYVNPFFALLNVILIFLIGKKFIGKKAGFVASLLLSLNVIQIWNSRFPTSEILGQFFLLVGFYFWSMYLEKNKKSFAFWAGVGFGEFLLTGVTSILIIPILAVYLFWRRNKRDIYFIIPFLLLLAHLIIQSVTYSSIYMETVILFFQRKEIYLLILLFIAILIFVALYSRQSLGYVRGSLSVIIIALFIYGYFVRPSISGSIEALNLVELGNWLSLLGLLLALIGVFIIIKKEKNEGLLVFVVTAIMFAVFFIYDKRMNSRYPFSLRRYIPIVIPAYCLCVSYLRRFNLIFLILLVIGIPLYRCRDIIRVKDHGGWVNFWSSFSEHMERDSVYISNRYQWARPLQDIFGKNVIAFTGNEEIINKKKGAYYISDLNKPYSLTVDFVEIYNKTYRGKYIEDSLKFPPRIKEQEICLRIFKITEIGDLTEREYLIDVGEENIGLLRGFDKARSFSGMEGSARWTKGEAKLVLPWFGDNVTQDLTIKACGMSKAAGVSIISLYINKSLITENYEIDEQIKDYIFHIPAGSVNTGNSRRVILTIKSNTWSPNKYGINGFPDELGILLNSVKIIMPIDSQ